MRIPTLLRRLWPLALITLPQTAWAYFEDTIQHVAGPSGLPAGLGGAEFGGIFLVIVQSFLGAATAVGIVMIVRAGLVLTVSQDEAQFAKAKKTIGAVAAALILLNLAPRIGEAYLAYQSGGADILAEEIIGLLNFFESLVGITAILFLVVSGIRAVTSYGSEDGTTHLKRTALGVAAGVLVIALKQLIVDAVIVERTPSQVLTAIAKIVQLILGIGALVATVVLIWAGLLMIVNIGKDEQYTRAKNLIVRVAIGLLVILTSMAIVQFVIA